MTRRLLLMTARVASDEYEGAWFCRYDKSVRQARDRGRRRGIQERQGERAAAADAFAGGVG